MSAEKVTPMAHHLEESFLIPRRKKPPTLNATLSTGGADTPSPKPGHARSLAGLVREQLPNIEQRLRFGWYRHHLAAELAETLGRPVQLEAFKKALWRARKAVQPLAPSEHVVDVPEPVLVIPTSLAKPTAHLVNGTAQQRSSTPSTKQPLNRPMGFDIQALQVKSVDDLI